jgi:GNAT superfamily N-acetyltransferase
VTPQALTALIDATWTAARLDRVGPWTIRAGAGGGSRVSAATASAPAGADDIPAAEAAMRALGQAPLFMMRPGEAALDAALTARGYRVKDPVTLYTAPVADLAGSLPPVTCFRVWPPLAVQRDIWAAGDIGPDRCAVMARVAGPKTTILGRSDDSPAGTLFLARHAQTAMVHAVEVPPRFRRCGMARLMMQGAAVWSQEVGAQDLAVLVTTANAAANELYTSLGMRAAAGYHYRIHPQA